MPVLEDLSFMPEMPIPTRATPLRGETAAGAVAVRRWLGAWDGLRRQSAEPPAACRLLVSRLDDDARVVTVLDGGQLVGLWALRRDRLGPLRIARRLGGELQSYDGLVVHRQADPQAVAAAAWAAVRRWSDVDAVQLDALRAHDPLAGLPALAGARPVSVARTLDLRPWRSGDAFAAGLPRRQRGSLGRRARKLEARGPARFTTETDPVRRVRAVQAAIDMKLGWLEAQEAAAPVFRSRSFQDALRACAADPDLTADLVVRTLRVGDTPVAVEICMVAGATCGSFIGAYDPGFAKEGVGAALTLDTIGWAIDQGLETYDLLPPDTAFKRQWSDHGVDVLAATLPLTPAGRALLPALRDGRAWLKARYQRLPEAPRQRVRGLLGLVLG